MFTENMRVRKSFGVAHIEKSGTVTKVWTSGDSGMQLCSVRYDCGCFVRVELPESLTVLNA
jgi:hypothetical protein